MRRIVVGSENELPGSDGVRIEFADERFSEAEAAANSDWREMTAYERAILARLLEVEFKGREKVAGESESVMVRQIDRCGCLEFQHGVEGARGPDPDRIVAEGIGPVDDQRIPVEIMLTLRNGHLLWLEFHRFGGRNGFWPGPDEFEVVAHGTIPVTQ